MQTVGWSVHGDNSASDTPVSDEAVSDAQTAGMMLTLTYLLVNIISALLSSRCVTVPPPSTLQ